MRLNRLLLVSLAGFAAGQDAISTEENCWTAMTRDRPQSINTYTYEETQTDTIYSTTRIQATTTVTPGASTTTTTTTSIITIKTTAKVKSDTLQVLNTVYTTVPVTVAPTTSVSTTTTSTVTTSGYTTTVLPPDSFTPIMDTLPGATLRSSSGVPARKRHMDTISSLEPPQLEEKQPRFGGSLAAHAAFLAERDAELSPRARAKYAYEVDCYITTFVPTTVVVTKTMRSAFTTTAPTPIKTITKTKTVQSTQTVVPPDATIYTTSTTTSTIQSTIVPTVTSVTTTTTTNTVNVATATAYPMCNSNNYADSKVVGGFSFNYPVMSFSNNQMGTDAGTPYNCCVQCIKTSGCIASYVYVPNNICSIIVNAGDSICSSTNVCSATIGWFSSGSVNSIFMNGPGLQYTGYYAP